MKDFQKTKLCLDMQIWTFSRRVLHPPRCLYWESFKMFDMDKAYSLNTPIIFWSLEMSKDPFRDPEEDGEILDPKVPYTSSIDALMYLEKSTRIYYVS